MSFYGGDRELEEEEREEREDGGLHESDEYFKCHERYGHDIGCEEGDDRDQYLTGEDVAEETEGERDEARKLRDELNEADDKIDRRREIDEFAPVAEESDGEDAHDLDRNDDDDRECEGDVEVGIDAAEERHGLDVPCLPRSVYEDRADARREFHEIGGENEEKDREDEREGTTGPFFAFEGLGYEIMHEEHDRLDEGLEFAGYHPQAAAQDDRQREEYGDRDPAGDQGIGDGNTCDRGECLGRECHVDPVRCDRVRRRSGRLADQWFRHNAGSLTYLRLRPRTIIDNSK